MAGDRVSLRGTSAVLEAAHGGHAHELIFFMVLVLRARHLNLSHPYLIDAFLFYLVIAENSIRQCCILYGAIEACLSAVRGELLYYYI